MATPDRDWNENLDLLGILMAKVSQKVHEQAEVLDGIAKAQAQVQERTKALAKRAPAAVDPQLLATTASTAAGQAVAKVAPVLASLVDTLEDLTGKKAMLAQRLRDYGRKPTWWDRHHLPRPLLVAGSLVLAMALTLGAPRVLARTETGCWAMGGTWYDGEAQQVACSFWTPQES